MASRDIYRILLAEYKCNAKRRGFDWSIPDGLFMQLIASNCFYCGKEPSPTTRTRSEETVLTNGIDRKRSKESYSPYNVVACCFTCNKLKHDMDRDEFLKQVKEIYAYSKKTKNIR